MHHNICVCECCYPFTFYCIINQSLFSLQYVYYLSLINIYTYKSIHNASCYIKNYLTSASTNDDKTQWYFESA